MNMWQICCILCIKLHRYIVVMLIFRIKPPYHPVKIMFYVDFPTVDCCSLSWVSHIYLLKEESLSELTIKFVYKHICHIDI